MKCPQCGRNASGRFCSHCGTAMGNRTCSSCGATPPSGSRFCTECGAQIGGGGGGATASSPGAAGNQNLGWWIAGAMMVVLLIILMLPILRPETPPPAGVGSAPATAAAGGAVDISNLSPREAADRLFNRVMTAVSQGNEAEAQQFLPMAIQSYDMARPLDQDGFFHLSLLHQQLPDFQAALNVAQEALAENPDHILNLSAAAQAALAAGDSVLGVEYYQHLLDVYDAESQKQLPEYQAHANMLPEMKAEAERLIGG